MTKTTVVTGKAMQKKSIASVAVNPKAGKASMKKDIVKTSSVTVSNDQFSAVFHATLKALNGVLPQVTSQESEDGTEFRIRSRATRIAVFYLKGKNGTKSIVGVPRQLHIGYDPELTSVKDGGKGKVVVKEQGRYGDILKVEMANTGAVGYTATSFDYEKYAKDLKGNEFLHRD